MGKRKVRKIRSAFFKHIFSVTIKKDGEKKIVYFRAYNFWTLMSHLASDDLGRNVVSIRKLKRIYRKNIYVEEV